MREDLRAGILAIHSRNEINHVILKLSDRLKVCNFLKKNSLHYVLTKHCLHKGWGTTKMCSERFSIISFPRIRHHLPHRCFCIPKLAFQTCNSWANEMAGRRRTHETLCGWRKLLEMKRKANDSQEIIIESQVTTLILFSATIFLLLYEPHLLISFVTFSLSRTSAT